MTTNPNPPPEQAEQDKRKVLGASSGSREPGLASRLETIAAKLRQLVAEEAEYSEGFALPKFKQKTILSAAELLETIAKAVVQTPSPKGLLVKRLKVDAKTAERDGHPIRAGRLKLAASAIEAKETGRE